MLSMPHEKKVAVPHFTSQFKQVVDLLVYLKRQPDFFRVNNLADALIHPDRPKKRRRLDELVESREAAKEVLDQIVDGDEVISPRLLFCKSFATGGIRAKARPGCSRGGRGDYSAGNLVVQIFCNRH